MYKVNGELFSCDITDSGIIPSREGDIQNFAKLVLLNGLSKFAQNITVGFLKLLSTHPIHAHCCLGKRSQFNLPIKSLLIWALPSDNNTFCEIP